MELDSISMEMVPYDKEAEQAVIGSMLIDAECVHDVTEILQAEDFYYDINKKIFKTIEYMSAFSKPIDPVTVLNEMKAKGQFSPNLEQYTRELMQITPTSSNALEYGRIVKDESLLRRLNQVADKIKDMIQKREGDPKAILEIAEQMIFSLRKNRGDHVLVPIGRVVESVYETMSDISSGTASFPAIPMGFSEIDRKTHGLVDKELIIIAARPGVGKTTFAMNIMRNIAVSQRDRKMQKVIAFFSLEMGNEELVMRFLSMQSGIEAGKLMEGTLSESEWALLGDAASEVCQFSIQLCDSASITVAEINAQCRRVENLGLVVIDYLQLMQSSGSGQRYANENRTQAVADMSRMLKTMAKELNVPVICLSQLNRASETRQDKRPQLSDLRESGSIEQDADIVIGLYREIEVDPDTADPFSAHAILLKNRKGEKGEALLNYMGECFTFTDRDYYHEE